jgi:hypothetical protein
MTREFGTYTRLGGTQPRSTPHRGEEPGNAQARRGGEYMAVLTRTTTNYYSAEHLGLMLRELWASNVNVVKLGAWAAFQEHWEVDHVTNKSMLEGKFQQINVSNSFAALGYGFTYLFSRDAADAKIHT